jgi:hypothetical protein
MSRGMIRAKDVIVDDVLDRIFKAWLAHKIEDLSLQDRWILERMEYIDACLKEGGVRSIYKNLVEDVYQAFACHDITRRTIETDIARTKKFFLTTRPREDKDYARGKYIEWGQRKLWKLDAEGDNLGYIMLYKELSKLEGFHKEDIERPDYDSVQPPPIMVVVNPADIGVPLIDNLDEELRILSMPKGSSRNNDTLDVDDAEVLNGDE